MSLRVRLLFNFPYFKVLTISIVLALLGLASIILSTVGFVKRIWGHYVGSGLWCGAFVLVTGICGMVAAHWKGVYSVRCFMGTSIVSTLLSIAAAGLSAGGLDFKSDFYIKVAHYANIDHGPTKLIHGMLLGIAVLEFVLSAISAYICVYHACFKKYKKTPTPATTGHSRKRFLRGSSRESTNSTSSRAPLAPSNNNTDRPHRKRRSRHSMPETESNGIKHQQESRSLINENRRDSGSGNRSRHRSSRSENEQNRSRTRPRDRGSHRPRRERPHDGQRQRMPNTDVVIENMTLCNTENVIPCDSRIQYMELQPSTLPDIYYHDEEPPIPIDEDEELPPYEEVARDSEIDNESMITSVSVNRESRLRGDSSLSSEETLSCSCNGRRSLELCYPGVNNNTEPSSFALHHHNFHYHVPGGNNNFDNGNVKEDVFRPPIPPRISSAEKEAFLRDYWLSDHPQGISYCGFSRNDSAVRDNIGPRTKRSKSFHQHCREREFARESAQAARRLSQQDPEDIEDPFCESNDGFVHYFKSQPNILNKYHDKRSASLSSAISLPSGNPPPKPPRLPSYDPPIDVKARNGKGIADKVSDGPISEEVDRNAILETNSDQGTCEKYFRDHGYDGECFATPSNRNSNGTSNPSQGIGVVNYNNESDKYTPGVKSGVSLSNQPIGHSTPKSSIVSPIFPEFSPIENLKPAESSKTAPYQIDTGYGTESCATSQNSQVVFTTWKNNDSDITHVSSVVESKLFEKPATKNLQSGYVQPPKLGYPQTATTDTKKTVTEDHLSLRPYLIRETDSVKSKDKSDNHVMEIHYNNQDSNSNDNIKNYHMCIPSPEIKYVVKSREAQRSELKFDKKSDCATLETGRTVQLSYDDGPEKGRMVCGHVKTEVYHSTPSVAPKPNINDEDQTKIGAISGDSMKIDNKISSVATSNAASDISSVRGNQVDSNISSRRKLLYPGSEPSQIKLSNENLTSKLPVLSLRPVQFNFSKKENGQKTASGSSSTEPEKTLDKARSNKEDIKQSMYNNATNEQHSKAAKVTLNEGAPINERQSLQREQEQQIQPEQPQEGQRRKPIYSILL